MISSQIIRTSIEELKSITRVDLCVCDPDGMMVATTYEADPVQEEMVRSFAGSPADSQVVGANHLLKIVDEGEMVYILIAKGGSEDAYMIGRIAVSQIQHLLTAYKERFDRNNFFQNLIMDNLLLVDVYNRAKKLHIEVTVPRVVLLMEIKNERDNTVIELLREMFSPNAGDYTTAVDEKNVILIKSLAAGTGYETVDHIAKTIVDMMNTEAMMNVRVAYGTIVQELKDVSKSYKEAAMALDVGKIFYMEKSVNGYNTLGIGRLIYQLPVNLCKIFIDEILGEDSQVDFDEEILTTVSKFFENDLNVSEASRQLFVHRNTLVYRLEKLEKRTGLDVRKFDDALTFKIALMVVSYMRYLEAVVY